MRKWAPPSLQMGRPGQAAAGGMAGTIAAMVERLGERDFSAHLLNTLHPLLPAASWSAYQVGSAGSGLSTYFSGYLRYTSRCCRAKSRVMLVGTWLV